MSLLQPLLFQRVCDSESGGQVQKEGCWGEVEGFIYAYLVQDENVSTQTKLLENCLQRNWILSMNLVSALFISHWLGTRVWLLFAWSWIQTLGDFLQIPSSNSKFIKSCLRHPGFMQWEWIIFLKKKIWLNLSKSLSQESSHGSCWLIFIPKLFLYM